MLDLACNNVSTWGAIDIFKKALELPKLEEIDLRWNAIRDIDFLMKDFNAAVLALLKKDNFKKLDIRYNRIVYPNWAEELLRKDKAREKKLISLPEDEGEDE